MMRQTRVRALKSSGGRPQSGLLPPSPVRTLKQAGRNGVPQEAGTSGGQWHGSGPATPAAGCHHDFGQVALASSKVTVDAANSAYFQDRQRFPPGGAGHGSPMVAQLKLKVGQPGDKYEQEADRVADQILRMPESRFPQKKGSFDSSDHESTPERVPPVVHEEWRSPGRSLEPATRRFMEPRFGHDFSQVRVHTGARAAAAAQAVQAQAFTLGRDVVFGAGQYAPETMRGKRLLAHELTHVIQQSGGLHRKQGGTRALSPREDEEEYTRRHGDTSTARVSRGTGVRSIQRDLALELPHPQATGKVLSETDMEEAKLYNLRVVAVIGEPGIRNLRDVLNLSPDPAEIDDAFVNAVVWWQAMHGLDEDGMLGPRTARRLFLEIGAEDVGHGELVSGPTYRAVTSLSPAFFDGYQDAKFLFEAEFADDPANEIYASCCEVRQYILWNAAYAAAEEKGPPHEGFPAEAPPNRWIEDRDRENKRYGHRTGQYSDLGNGDEYIDDTGNRNAAFGHIYRGRDHPKATRHAGMWRFKVRVIDVCNNNHILGEDALHVNWHK